MTTFPDALEVFAQISTGKQTPQMSDSICQNKAVLLFPPYPNSENSTQQDLPIALLLLLSFKIGLQHSRLEQLCSRGPCLRGTCVNSSFCLPVLSRR